MTGTYKFTAYLRVYDERAVFNAALANYVASMIGTSTDAEVRKIAERDGTAMLSPNGSIDVAACVQQILDPGGFPGDGANIDGSECECMVDDSEETYATEDGRHVRHDMSGYYLCTTEEGEHEDAGNASVGFDGRPHFEAVKDALAAANNGGRDDGTGWARAPPGRRRLVTLMTLRLQSG